MRFFLRRFALLSIAVLILAVYGCGGPVDTKPPEVSSTSPTDNQTEVSVNAAITVNFSESIKTSTVSSTTFYVTDSSGSQVGGTLTVESKSATFTPTSQLNYNTTYFATLTTGVTDGEDNELAEDFSWHFTTESVPSPVSSLSGGLSHAVAARADGTVWAWGDNTLAQLGTDPTSTTSSTAPLQISGLANITNVASGDSHSIALRSDGTVWAWGDNSSGQLSIDPATTASTHTPQQVSVTGAIAVASGASHSMALKNDGTVWAWGNNASGQLGNGATTSTYTPAQVSFTGVTIVAIAAGASHSLALDSNDNVWAWGDNSSGQLGNGTTTSSTTPVQVTSLSGARGLCAGIAYSATVLQDGTIRAWGDNSSGQLGNGTTTPSLTPVQVSGLNYMTGIACSSANVIAIKWNATVWAWGDNSSGQLGNGTTASSSTPVQVSSFTGAEGVFAGSKSSYASRTDGTLWGWGENSLGQLGNGTTDDASAVTQISGI